MRLVKESLILGTIISLFCGLWTRWLESGAYRLYRRFCTALRRAVSASVVVSFFRADWDKHLGSSRICAALCAPLLRLRAYFAGSSRFAAAARGSRVLAFLDVRTAFVFLCLAAFAIPFLPTLVLLILTLASFVLYALNVVLGRAEMRGAPGLVGVLMLLFALCYAVSAVTGLAFPASMESLLMILGLMTAASVCSALLRDKRRRDIFLTVLLLSGALMSLYGIYQYLTGVQADAAWVDSENFAFLTSRAYSTFGNPNVMGEYLIPVCCVGVGMIWTAKSGAARAFYLALTAILAAGLFATGSRGSMLGLACAALLFVIVADHRLVPLAAAGIAAMPLILPPTLISRFAAVLTMTDSSSRYRMSIYAACFDMVRDYWTTGIGVSAFSIVYPHYLYSASNAYHSHNLFLQVLIELGALGFVIFLLLLAAWFQRLYRRTACEQTSHRYLTGAVMCGLAGLLVQGLTDHLWFNYRIVLLFYIIMGIGLACAGGEEA